MDKTYAETMGQPAFDWNLFLGRAELGLVVKYTPEHREAIWRSSFWTTCACGNQCAIIPRQATGSPLDDELTELGVNFCGNIADGEWRQAHETLRQIEARAAILIAEELARRGAV